MKALLVLLSLIGIVAGTDLGPLVNMCANAPVEQQKPSDKMILPSSYKVYGSVTNWQSSVTWLLMESVTKNFRVLERKNKNGVEKWIQDLNGDKHIDFITMRGDCDEKAPPPRILNVTRFDSIIGNDTSSLSAIVSGLMGFVNNNTGFFVKDHIDVVGGINTMKWVSCVNGTTSDDTKVLVEVRYGGDDSIDQAMPGFPRPILYSIRLAELASFNSTVTTNHWSIEFNRFDSPTGDEASIEHGVVCEDRNASTISLKPLNEYAANLNFFDHETNTSEVVEVLYSKQNKTFTIAGSSFRNILKTTQNIYFNDTDYILHDFKYGYEFVMSRGACEKLKPLTDATSDVLKVNTSLEMQPMEYILVDASLAWAQYEDVVDMSGVSYKTYRAIDDKNYHVLELHLTDDGEIHLINRLNKKDRKLIRTMTVTKVPATSSRLNMASAQVSDCYDNGQFANNTWIVPIKDKNLTDLQRVGLSRLNKAVAESINKNVAAVIPYRIVVFYVENRDDGLSIILRIAEKTDVKPGSVGYDYNAELTTSELFTKMNVTLFSEKMPIIVETSGALEEWIADANAMKSFPPDTENGFLGYTGGAMFVLTIFCLLIGVSIGAVGVFVVTRRQRISTLAYQVFE